MEPKKFQMEPSISLEKIDTQILNLSKKYQNGRVSQNDTTVSFAFTEYWFRTSGINRKRTKSESDFVQRDSFVSDSILR